MSVAVTVICATHRQDPGFGWLVDGLARQIGLDDEVELVLVDGLATDSRQKAFGEVAGDRLPFAYLPAKPTPLNGPYMRTTRPLFAAASARNTGIVAASSPYVAFIDDCAVPMPGWWEEVREAARHQYIVAGAYQKHAGVDVTGGILRSSQPLAGGIDSRWNLGEDTRVVPLAGGRLYGSSFGIPRQLLLEINGFDELCDPIGGEDYDLGVRLELAGHRLFYSRSMLTIESQDHHSAQPCPPRIDPVLEEAQYFERLAQFGVSTRSTDGRCDASHMVLDLVFGLREAHSLGNHYELSELSAADLPATADTMPSSFWFDGTPWAEL